MYSEFLIRVLTDSTLSGGCGMSARPAFYSGRGATTTDLNSSKLERIWAAIQKNQGDDAAFEFVKMVAALPCLSATDFLLALARLEASDWEWSGHVGSERGAYADSEAAALGTVLETIRGSSRVDETEVIRGDFLRARGICTRRSRTIYGDW